MSDPYAHPETGAVLETLDDFRRAITEVDERLSPLYRLRYDLRAEMSERFPAPRLPSRTRRTDLQERVARCPRCGGNVT